MIAHLYGLTEEEFAYILTTFPVVSDSVKQSVNETLGRKKNRDGYKLFLTNLLLDRLGDDWGPLIQVTFHEVEGSEQ